MELYAAIDLHQQQCPGGDRCRGTYGGAACNVGATAPRHFAVDMVALRENVHDRQGRAGRRR